ncbi:MAG: hypothetical protein MUD01_18615, partial [Chloroflexaceae bacterium]|nr:hypothetical protein [Chloroflexaceae bacterium]
MATLLRTLRFTGFTLLEYARSGRIVLELIATAAYFYIFLFRWPLDGAYFFTAVGVFLPLLMLYTMSAMVGLGDRPQGYLVLARRLGRGSYLLGLFLSAMLVAGSVYGLLSALTALINPASGLGPGGWLRGSLPLLLNTGLLGALLLMLSPLVFPTGWRLFVLGLVALAFSGNFISGSIREQLQSQFAPAYTVLTSVQALL